MVCSTRPSKGPGVEFKVHGMGYVNFHMSCPAFTCHVQCLLVDAMMKGKAKLQFFLANCKKKVICTIYDPQN